METPGVEEPFATEANLMAVLHEARYGGGLAASGQRSGFGGNLFTRDTCRVLLDTMDHLPSMARELLGILPQMQGIAEDPATNEFPNAMPHQVFRQIVGGRYVPDQQVETAEYWTDKWGVPMQHNPVDGKSFAIYNSSDGPALYLLSLAEYCRLYPDHRVMRDQFLHRPTGETRTVGEAGRRCVQFIMDSFARTDATMPWLYAVPNTNPKQTSPSGVMRDGSDSYYYPVGEAGAPVDFTQLAYIDNQALAYEALMRAATELYSEDPNAQAWLDQAIALRHCTLDVFWMEDRRMFAAAIDTQGKQVKLESTAALELLNGPFLKDIIDGPDIVRSLVNWLYDEHVMTPIGPRMLHEDFGRYEGEYYAYQGSGAVWPHVSGIIAKGMRNHWGLYAPSYDLGVLRTLGLFNRTGEAVELSYVERRTNDPVYNPYPPEVERAGARLLAAAELGQLDQSWAASAGLREIWDWMRGIPQSPRGSWQRAFVRQIMEKARDVPSAAAGKPAAPLYIDTELGRQLKTGWAEARGHYDGPPNS